MTTPSTPQMAKHEAADVGRTAAQGGEQVAQTVADQTKRVARETGRQARDLLHEGRQQLTEQARGGQQKAAKGLHTLADQLEDMHAKSDGSGVGPEVIKQAAGHARSVASWLDEREPGDLLGEVRDFARRKPGVFLAGAALAGVLVGRLTRGVVSAQKDDSDADERTTPQPQVGQTYASQGFQATEPVYAPPVAAPPVTPPPVPAPQQVPPGYTTPPAPGYSQPPASGPAPWQGPGTVQP